MVRELSIPVCFEDLTPQWIQGALAQRFHGVRVKRAEVVALPGYKPNKVRAHLVFDGDSKSCPDTIVIKGGFARKITSEYAQDLTRPLDLGMEMEARAYQEFVPTIEVETPEIFHVDLEGGVSVMMMEDLDRRGGQFFTPFEPMNYQQALAYMDAHSRVHSRWWGSAELDTGGRFGPETQFGQCGTRIHTEYLGEFLQPVLWRAIMNNPHNAGLPRRFRDRSRMGAAFAALAQANLGVTRTIVHGDEHIKNFYWTPEGRAGFVDWNSRVEPWANSLTYFITACIDSVDRRLWERALLQRYLSGLARNGVEPPSFDEAWLAYRRAIVFPLFCWAINNSALQPPSVNCAYMARTATAAIELDSFAALDI